MVVLGFIGWSLGSLGFAVVVVGFVQGRCVNWGAPPGVVGLVRGRFVRWDAPWGSPDSLGVVVGFIGVHPGNRQVRLSGFIVVRYGDR